MKALGIKHPISTLSEITEFNLSLPQPKSNEVIVSVRNVALNPADYRMTIEPGPVERKFPFIIGSDFSGIVTQVGKSVTNFKPGEAVYGKPQIPNFGSLAEQIAIPANLIVHKPKTISFPQAATIPVTFQTAYMNLVTKAKLSSGQKILILGGAGGVGSMAVQLAHSLGAEVWATGLAKDLPTLKSLDVDRIIDTSKNEAPLGKIDILFDTVGLKAQKQALPFLKDGAKIVSSAVIKTDPSISNNPTLKFIPFEFAHGDQRVLELANQLIAKQKLNMPVIKLLPFTSLALQEGLQAIWQNIKIGRLIVQVTS